MSESIKPKAVFLYFVFVSIFAIVTSGAFIGLVWGSVHFLGFEAPCYILSTAIVVWWLSLIIRVAIKIMNEKIEEEKQR